MVVEIEAEYCLAQCFLYLALRSYLFPMVCCLGNLGQKLPKIQELFREYLAYLLLHLASYFCLMKNFIEVLNQVGRCELA